MNSGAIISSCQKYRYRLWRVWDQSKPILVFCMLNPSTADAVENDATISRCQKRAELLGFGGIEVINVFALRSTDPRNLYLSSDPVGTENDRHISDVLKSASLVICAWGEHGRHMNRQVAIMELIKKSGLVPHALKINRDGSPAHPLYIGYGVKPKPMV